MLTILLVVLILLLLGGGGYYYRVRDPQQPFPDMNTGVIGLVVVIVLLFILFGRHGL